MNGRSVRVNLIQTLPSQWGELVLFRNRLLDDVQLILARLSNGRVFNYVGR